MEERLGRLLAMSSKVAKENFNERLSEVGSSFTTFLILKHAASSPGVSQRQLARGVGIEGPTLTHHLDRLAAEGLIRRVRQVDDRRVWCVELTAEGKEHLHRVETHANKIDAEFRSMFTEEELRTMFAVLTRIRDRYAKEGDVHHASPAQ
jgi:MarR family transcriptional regulator, transcriptional regulator for hemolysin